MRKWVVIVSYDACRAVEVKANSEEDAKRIALDLAPGVHLCHQCSDHVDIGEPVDAIDAWEES